MANEGPAGRSTFSCHLSVTATTFANTKKQSFGSGV